MNQQNRQPQFAPPGNNLDGQQVEVLIKNGQPFALVPLEQYEALVRQQSTQDSNAKRYTMRSLL
jgi:hypothetical protein